MMPKFYSRLLLLLAIAFCFSFFSNHSPGEPDPGKPGSPGIPFPGIIPSWYLFHAFENGTDPIKFDIQSNKPNPKVGEEIQLTISARLLNTSGLLYYLPGSKGYTIKLLLPDGFHQTDGTLSVNGASDELSSSKQRVVYTVKGYFSKENTKGCFRLIRSHRGASDASKFAVSATHCISASRNDVKSGITVASAVTFNWCSEAESGTGNRPSDNVSAASGGHACGGFGNSSEYMQYTLSNVPGAGAYTLSLYYCGGETAQFGVVVNGVLQTASASSTGSWIGPYVEKTVSVNLVNGTNTIRIQGNGGGFSLDKLCVNGESSGGGCTTPTISLGTPSCTGSSTYAVSFTNSAGSTVTSSAGTVSGGMIVNIPVGTNITATATVGTCTAQQSASSPTNCSSGTTNWCAEAESGSGNRPTTTVSGASGGQAVGGFGNSSEWMDYSITGVGSTGQYTLTLYYSSGEGTAQFGLVVNNVLQTTSAPGNGRWIGPFDQKTVTVNLNAGTNSLRVQGNGAGFILDKLCVNGGSTPCSNPSLSLGTPTCTGTSTYSVSFTAESGSSVTTSAGSISGNSVTNIPAGTNVTVTASKGGCSSQQTANSPSCSTPINNWCAEAESGTGSLGNQNNSNASGGQSVGGFGTSGEYKQYTITNVASAGSYVLSLYYCSGESANFGIVVNGNLQTATAPGNSTWVGPFIEKQVNISLNAGNNTLRIQGNNGGFTLDRLCVNAGTSQCQTPTLSLGTPTCSGTGTYSVSFTVTSGATVTTSDGTVSGNSVINIPVGTNVTVTAASGTCTVQQSATSPGNCNPGGGYKVFVFGNSITHNRWGNGTDWGMAASAANKDYYHILKGYLQSVHPDLDMREFASFPGTPQAGGIPLDIIDGPRWESDYWFLDNNSVFPGGLTRYKAVQDWQPNLIIMRISENVTDVSHNFTTYYKQVIDYLKQQSPNCRVVLTTSVWNQVDVSNLIASVGAERNYTVVNLNGISGAQAGTQGHPTDAAMQTIADRIWSGIQGSNPPVDPPIDPNFDWTPIPSTYVAPGDSLVLFETSNIKAQAALKSRFGTLAGVGASNIIGPRVGGSLYSLYNKTEPRFNYLHYPHYSVTDPCCYAGVTENYTLGMGYGEGMCLYMNPRPNYVPSQIGIGGVPPDGVIGLGRNPYHGDDMGNSSKVLVYGKRSDNSGYYVKTQPILYNAYGAYAFGTIFEEWRDFSGRYYITHSKISTNYTGTGGDGYAKQEFLRSDGQEAPCIYVNGSVDNSGARKNKVFWYGGNNPCQNQPASNVDVAAGVEGTYMRPDGTHVTEPFVFVSSSENSPGLAMIMESSRLRISKMGSGESRWGDDADPLSPNTNATYVSQDRAFMMDNQGVYYMTTKVYMADNLADARAQACLTQNRFAPTLNYNFNKADRMGWVYASYGDLPNGTLGKRTWDDPDNALNLIQQRGFWRMYFSESMYAGFSQSNVSWDAASTQKIYIKMAYTGNKTSWGASWVQNEQLPNRSPSTAEEIYRFPKGIVPQSQNVTFNVIGDGVARVYEINVGANSGWANKITELQILPHMGQNNSQGGQVDLYWISSSPNGPSN